VKQHCPVIPSGIFDDCYHFWCWLVKSYTEEKFFPGLGEKVLGRPPVKSTTGEKCDKGFWDISRGNSTNKQQNSVF
jgi:hypothetical protein